MTSLKLLDPVDPDDPRFDRDGPDAARVRAAALARARDAKPRPRSHARPAIAGLAVTALIVAGIMAATTSRAPDARAALIAAAERTDGYRSGRVVLTARVDRPDLRSRGDERYELRFDDGDLELVTRAVVEFRGRTAEQRTTLRQVDGVAYERDDTRPGAGFRRIGPVSPTGFADQLARQAGGDGLLRLVRSAADVIEEHGRDGTTFRATATVADVEAAAPTAAGQLPSPESQKAVELRVTVAADGRVRRVVAERPGVRRQLEYFDLGVAQPIERP